MENQASATNVAITASAIRTEKSTSEIGVDEIFKSDFQKEGTMSAQLRQSVTIDAYYPTKKTTNSLHDNLFTTEEFGFSEQKYTSVENRVCWMDVPTGTTIEQVISRIKSNPKSCLYKILSNKPILTDNQEYAVAQGQRTYDEFASTQVVRYPKDTTIGEGEDARDVSGQIVLDTNGKVQYRRVFFSVNGKDDIDLRTKNIEEQYISEEIKMELEGASVLEGQKI